MTKFKRKKIVNINRNNRKNHLNHLQLMIIIFFQQMNLLIMNHIKQFQYPKGKK